jgi:hypothetical protein
MQDIATIHTLAGFAAAKRTPDDELVKKAIEVLQRSRRTLGLRELYCTAIPALFFAGRQAEAIEFFKKFDKLTGAGCDEAIDIEERGLGSSLPCIVQERIAFSTALLGKFDDALTIARTCNDKERMRLLLLRLTVQTEDDSAAMRFFQVAARSDKTPAAEVVPRAAALARLGRLDEAAKMVKPAFDQPESWFDGNDEPFRPLFNALLRTGRPGPLLDGIISAQERASKASESLSTATAQGLELVRMLTEAKRSDALAAAGAPIIARATEGRKELARRPRPLLDAAEIAILTGQPQAAGPFLDDALNYLRTAPRSIPRPPSYARAIELAYMMSPAQLAISAGKLRPIIDRERDAEARAQLTAIASGAYLKIGDPFEAGKYAREAALPHRAMEAYCRILDDAVAKSKAATRDYGLKYPNWPAPSFMLAGGGTTTFRDAFGPQTCKARKPVDKRS